MLYNRIALVVAVLVVTLTGCKTGELENRLDDMERRAAAGEVSFRAGDYSAADTTFKNLAAEPTVSAPLYRLDSVPCLILSGREDEAYELMQHLRADLEELYDPESEKKALSKWHGEVNKVFKGSPHEMTAFYALLSLSYAQRGEYENAWRCVQNGLLHDTDAKEDKYQSDDALLLYLGTVFANKIGEVDSAEQCRKRLKDALANRGIVSSDVDKYAKSAYAALLSESATEPNAFVVFWTGTPPQFGRDGKYGEKRMILKGSEYAADFMTVSVDGGEEIIVPEKIGDINFQATTRGGREMDNILADKADFKQDMKNFQEVSLGLSGFCFAAAAATFSTSKERLIISGACLAAGVTFLVLDGVFYCFYDKTDPRADIRAWKTLPGQLNILPLRLTLGQHELTIRSRIGGDAMTRSVLKFNVTDTNNLSIAHVVKLNDTIQSDALRLHSKTLEIGNKNIPKDKVVNYPEIENDWDSSMWCSVFGLDFQSGSIKPKNTIIMSYLAELLVRHGYIKRWSASDAIAGMCPPHPDKTLVFVGTYFKVDKTENEGNFLDTCVAVAVRDAGDCTPDGKFKTGPVKFFYAWSRKPTLEIESGRVGYAEKLDGVKAAIENLFRVPEFRLALSRK